jgi:hypothetical protein
MLRDGGATNSLGSPRFSRSAPANGSWAGQTQFMMKAALPSLPIINVRHQRAHAHRPMPEPRGTLASCPRVYASGDHRLFQPVHLRTCPWLYFSNNRY